MTHAPSFIETERRRRINAALWAYAYEVMNDSLVSDAKYDATCREIDPAIETGHSIMDRFFGTEFDPSTGMWIYRHPEVNGIAAIYQRITGRPARPLGVANPTPPVPQGVSAHGFKTQTEMKIYLASLGLRVLGHSIFYPEYGRVDFEFDREWFTIRQESTGIERVVRYDDWFGRAPTDGGAA